MQTQVGASCIEFPCTTLSTFLANNDLRHSFTAAVGRIFHLAMQHMISFNHFSHILLQQATSMDCVEGKITKVTNEHVQ